MDFRQSVTTCFRSFKPNAVLPMGLLYRSLLAIPSKGQIRGVFDSILLHLYMKNIVLAQKLTKLQHFKEHFWMENQFLDSTIYKSITKNLQACLEQFLGQKWKYSIWYILITCLNSRNISSFCDRPGEIWSEFWNHDQKLN